MEDDLRPLGVENAADAPLVGDVGDVGGEIRAQPALAEFLVHLKECAFGLLEEDQALGKESQGLAADFRADRAARAGDQDALPGEKTLQLGGVEICRRPAEQLGAK